MPHKFERLKIKLPKGKDRRVKYTDKQKAEVLVLFKKGVAIREISRRLGIGRRTVQFIIYPERLAKVKEQFKDRGQSAKSYAKVRGKKWARIMKEHRRYKSKVLKNEKTN